MCTHARRHSLRVLAPHAALPLLLPLLLPSACLPPTLLPGLASTSFAARLGLNQLGRQAWPQLALPPATAPVALGTREAKALCAFMRRTHGSLYARGEGFMRRIHGSAPHPRVWRCQRDAVDPILLRDLAIGSWKRTALSPSQLASTPLVYCCALSSAGAICALRATSH